MEERVEFKTYTKMSKNSIADYKDLINRAKELGQRAIAITDDNSVEIFPKVYKYLKENHIKNIKVIYGATVNMIENDFLIPITILVRNKEGLQNLYKIISLIKTTNFDKYGKQVITKKQLASLSTGLLYGLDIQSMYDIYNHQTDKQVSEDLMWYDFLEVEPPSSSRNSQDNLQRMIRIAKETHKIVIATGNVHYLKKEEQEDYKIIFPSEDSQGEKYLKSTIEMRQDFNFLEDDIVFEIVQKNPNKLANLIENVDIYFPKLFLPKIKNSKQIFLDMIYHQASNLYGDKLPFQIEKRIQEELYGKTGNKNGIINNNYEVIYLIYQKLVDYSHQLGYPVFARGKVASSLLAYLLGLTNINPLPPHYYCSNCHEVIFETSHNFPCGLDMPAKKCPKCSKEMSKDGFDIPYEALLGYDGSKIPDIDMNFADEIYQEIWNYVRELFGRDRVLKAGVIGTYSQDNAFKIIMKNLKKNNSFLSEKEQIRLANKLIGVKTVTGQHPGSLIIIPQDKEVFDFTPTSYPNNIKRSDWKSTHFSYDNLNNSLLKIDILASDIPTVIAKLETKTNVKIQDIQLWDSLVFEQMMKSANEDVFKFDKYLSVNIFKKRNPNNFSELIKTIGICHNPNIEEFTNKYDITCQEDIFHYLIFHHVDSQTAYQIMKFVSMEKSNKNHQTWNEIKEKMLDSKIPLEFIEYCSKIDYLLPKSHIISLSLTFCYLCWYKMYFPLQFKSVMKTR